LKNHHKACVLVGTTQRIWLLDLCCWHFS